MIKINLNLRKNQGARSGTSILSDLEATLEKFGLKNPTEALQKSGLLNTALQIGIILVVGFTLSALLDRYKAYRVKDSSIRIDELNREVAKVDTELRKYSGYEKTKEELENTDKAIRTKIATIEELIAGRGQSVKVLISLSESTPKKLWFTNLKVAPKSLSSKDPNDKGMVQIQGESYGLGEVSDFMSLLESSAYFRDVKLQNSSQTREKGVETANFSIEVGRR